VSAPSRVSIELEVGGALLRATVREDFGAAARDVLKGFSSVELGEGAAIDVGWGPIRLRASGPDFEAVAPDYRSRFPRRRETHDLTDTLWVRALQDEFHARSGLPVGPSTTFDNSIYVIEGAWAADVVCMRREELDGSPFSGWLVDVAVPPQPGSDVDTGRIGKVATVFAERPALLAALRLPPGFVVVADSRDLTAVHDASGDLVYSGPFPDPAMP
jgi:hypothetical protein